MSTPACPKCSGPTFVLDTRRVVAGGKAGTTRRRRKCFDCGFRFTTYQGKTAVDVEQHEPRPMAQARTGVQQKRLTFPVHAYGSAREFKIAKRRDLRVARKALDQLMVGSYYLPERKLLIEARQTLAKLSEAMSPARWGRNKG